VACTELYRFLLNDQKTKYETQKHTHIHQQAQVFFPVKPAKKKGIKCLFYS